VPRRVATHPGKITGFSAARGRPRTNIGQYLLRPNSDVNSGFQMLNSTPEAIELAKEHYLKVGELPPALQPNYLRRPEVIAKQKSDNISKGFRKPKSFQG
jgi:hypothetical protein